MDGSGGTAEADVVVVGGGHNALVAAAYLARAGRSVVLLERLARVGGAAVSSSPFPGLDARISRYSYLVSLLPRQIVDDLGLRVTLARRRYSSYTPRPDADGGILIDNADADATAGALGAEADAWGRFGSDTAGLARIVFPTLLGPLPSRSELRRELGDDRVWEWLVERPVGEAIREAFADDVVRGIVITDALIGTFAPNIDVTLAANRCFLYHVIGGGTGDWDVPVGGMGVVSGELERAARAAGVTIVTDAEVTAVTPAGEVHYRTDRERTIVGDVVLVGVAPAVLEHLLGDDGDATKAPEGAQVKVNLLLSRLPRLRDTGMDAAAAFGGTFHVNESWSQLDSAYRSAAGGEIANPLPCEIYCHSLTDPSILSPELRASGAQTLTVFGLHTPHRLAETADPGALRARLQDAVIRSVDSVLAEPIEPLLLTDADGRPAIETKTTLDLDHALGLPGGNIFHGPLQWPFVENDAELATAAQRWGVATRHPRILLCGAGAQRGGGVSGIGGHNAAMAALEGH